MAVIAVALSVAYPFGNDSAAHLYLTSVFARSGFSLWNNLWYFGRYDFVGYSYLYYPLASGIGVTAPAVAGLFVFQLIVVGRFFERHLWRRYVIASLLTSPTVAALILTGAYPFLMSLGLGAIAVLLYLRRSRVGFALFLALAAATSPLAVAGVAFVVLWEGLRTWLRSRSSENSPLVGEVIALARSIGGFYLGSFVVVVVLIAGVEEYFQIRGSYPYYGTDLAMVLAFSVFLAVASPLLGKRSDTLALLIALGAYFAVNVALFLVPSSVGGNAARVGEVAPSIVAALALRIAPGRLRGWGKTLLSLGAVGATLWMSLSVEAPVFDPSQGYLTTASNWTPVVAWLRATASQRRVEYVDSLLHEGAYYLPEAGIAIARGWFRQDDFPQNALFYQSDLTPGRYRSWLCANQIAAVVLPPAPYDYSAVAEATLVRSGLPYLSPPRRIGRFAIYRVLGCSVTTPVRIISPTLALVQIPAGGKYLLPLNYSRLLKVSFGSATSTSAGRIELTTTRSGVDRLSY